MREWPLNSAMLTTTTHSKLREALDGTDTQVATYVIDRWTAKMKRTEGYITREISRRGGGQFGRCQEVLLVEYQKRRRRNHPRLRTEDELWPSPQPRYRWSSSLTIPLDRWRRPHKGPVLKPASLPNSLYWACWVWVCSHLQCRDPTIGADLLDREWRTVEGFPALRAFGITRVALAPTRGRTTRQHHGQPPLDPDGGRRWSHKTLSRGSAAGTVFWRSMLVPSSSLE